MEDEDKHVQEELRLYISSLEDHLRNIQNDSSMQFFKQGRFALDTEQQREKYLLSKNLLDAKEFEGFPSKEKFKECLRRFEQELHCVGLGYKDRVKQGLEFVGDISTRLSGRVSKNKIVQDKGRTLVEENFFNELAKRDAINNELFGNNMEHSFEKLVVEKATEFQDAMYNFSTTKQGILSSIWNLEKSSETDDAEVERLKDYFHQLDQEIKRTLDERRDRIAKLKREQESLTSELNKSLKKNAEELKKEKTHKIPFKFTLQTDTGSSCSSSELHQDADIENLKLFNYELTARLSTAKTENEDLKKQFWSAYRKIHQVMEFKTFVLEEMLRLKQPIK